VLSKDLSVEAASVRGQRDPRGRVSGPFEGPLRRSEVLYNGTDAPLTVSGPFEGPLRRSSACSACSVSWGRVSGPFEGPLRRSGRPRVEREVLNEFQVLSKDLSVEA